MDQPDVHVEITLVRQPGRTVGVTFGGSGVLWGAGPQVDLVVSGTRRGDSVSLSLEPPGYVPIVFDGVLAADGASLVGTLGGSGIRPMPFRLERTP